MRHENFRLVSRVYQTTATCNTDRRRLLKTLGASAFIPASAVLGGCGGSGAPVASQAPAAAAPNLATSVSPRTRSWRMGFGGIPPDFKAATAIHGIDIWSQRAEIAAIHEEAPWAELLAGADPYALLARDKVDLVRYYRAKGLKLLITVELNDGLARDQEAPQLRALGRSLAEPEVQSVWLAYVTAVARVLRPDWLCLGAETNLVRQIAPPLCTPPCAKPPTTPLPRCALLICRPHHAYSPVCRSSVPGADWQAKVVLSQASEMT